MSFCSSSVMFFVFFFFKQKTAYEMRISDWSSDVCSSDLPDSFLRVAGVVEHLVTLAVDDIEVEVLEDAAEGSLHLRPSKPSIGILSIEEIGRASCRERVCQYV